MTMTRREISCYLIVLQTSLLLLFQCICQVGAQDTPYLIFANRDRVDLGIRRANLDGSNIQTLVDTMTASGLDYDYMDRTLFWSSIESKTIFKAGLDGSSPVVLTNDTLNPETIGWDWINKKMYWTDVTRGTLEVMDPETGYRKVLVNVTRDSQIRGLHLDPIRRWMYYTTVGDGRSVIAKISMDGTESMTLHDNRVVGQPNGVTLDSSSNTLYWVDARNRNVGKSRVDLGSPNMTVFTFPNLRNPFHTTYYNGGLFITDWIRSSVLRLDLDSTPELNDIVPRGERGSRTGMIRVFAEAKQQFGPNPCDSAQCSQLCLLSSSDPRGYSCACRDGVKLNQNRITCGNETPPTTIVTSSTTSGSPTTTASPTASRVCASTMCFNGGTCLETESLPNFRCLCPPSYTGPLCGEPVQTENLSDDNILVYVLGVLGVLAFLAFLLIGLLVFIYWTMKLRAKSGKHRRTSSLDGMSGSSRDSSTHLVLVNGPMSEHDYMSIKSRGNSPAPSRILICNGLGVMPNNYSLDHPQLGQPPVTSGSQTLDHMFSTRGPVPPEPRPNGQLPEPIYNTVKSAKRQTL